MPEPVEEPEEELAQGEQAVVGEAPVLEVSANLRKVVQYPKKRGETGAFSGHCETSRSFVDSSSLYSTGRPSSTLALRFCSSSPKMKMGSEVQKML